MKTDIEIAQEATLLPIKEVAANIGIKEDDLELYGKYKAKFDSHFMDEVKNNEDGKLVLVTAINPTPPPAAPPLIPKHGPRDGSRRAQIVFFPSLFNAWDTPTLVVVFPSFYRGFSCDHICKQLISSNA